MPKDLAPPGSADDTAAQPAVEISRASTAPGDPYGPRN